MKYASKSAAQAAIRSEVAAAKAIAAKADAAGRNLTATERARISEHVETARDAKSYIELEEAGDQKLRDELTSVLGTGGRKTALRRGDGPWAKSMTDHLNRFGAKTLTPNGAITVPSLSAGIIAGEDRPRSILQLIPFVPLEGTNQFSYLRETVRTHAASTVAPGARKPVSTYSLELIEDTAKTIAHLTEPINRQDLADVELLRGYIEGALRNGCELELEDQVLNGAGSVVAPLDDMTGIRNTSGVQVQAWDTDRFVTARKAVTLLEDEHLDPSGFAWTMSPTEWEAFELSTTTDRFTMADPGATGSNLPIDRARRLLWGYRVVTSSAMDDGIALLGDFGGSAAVREREGVEITWSDSVGIAAGGTAFEHNQLVWRGEGRWGLEVHRPAAFVEADLTAV